MSESLRVRLSRMACLVIASGVFACTALESGANRSGTSAKSPLSAALESTWPLARLLVVSEGSRYWAFEGETYESFPPAVWAAVAFARLGDYESARETAGKIPPGYDRERALHGIEIEAKDTFDLDRVFQPHWAFNVSKAPGSLRALG